MGFALQDVFSTAHLVGVDHDSPALDRARVQATAEERAARFVEGDVQAALPPGPYDLVFMSLLLLHVPQPAQVLAHAYTVLRPGARCG